jgi:ABC-type branched-subunit amino acid transport system permease subunit
MTSTSPTTPSPRIMDLSNKRVSTLAVAVGAVLLLGLVPSFASSYAVSTLRDALAFSLLAVGLDFLWGKTGLLSFGHAAFFGAGAYGVGVISVKTGLDPLIAAWVGLAVGIGIAAVVSLLVGYFLIFGGVRGPYFTIVTLALAVISGHIIVGFGEITGGDAGLIGVQPLQFPGVHGASPLSSSGQYWLILGVLSAVTMTVWWLCSGRYGQVLQAIQDNELRAQALGHNTAAHLLLVFVASAVIAALGGGLYGSTVGFVAPDVVGTILSVQAIVWVAIGGRGTLIGPIVATALVIWLEQKISSIDTRIWPLIIGALFILSVFVFPDGILGRLKKLFARQSDDEGGSK